MSSIDVEIAGTKSGMAFGGFLIAGSLIGYFVHPLVPVAAGVGLMLWFGRGTLILTRLRRGADAAYAAQARDRAEDPG